MSEVRILHSPPRGISSEVEHVVKQLVRLARLNFSPLERTVNDMKHSEESRYNLSAGDHIGAVKQPLGRVTERHCVALLRRSTRKRVPELVLVHGFESHTFLQW